MAFKNIEDRRRYMREWKKKERRARKAYLDSIKLSRGCESCGVFDAPLCMDFHHKNEEEKESVLSGRQMYGLTKAKLNAELDKCMVLCKSCHHKYHHGLLSFITHHSPIS